MTAKLTFNGVLCSTHKLFVINEIRGVAPTNSTSRSCFVDPGFCVAVANQKDPGYACGWMLGIYQTFSVAL